MTPSRRSSAWAKPRASARGFSLAEVLVVAGLAAALLVAGVPVVGRAADVAEATAAARWLAGRIAAVRAEAARRQRTYAVRFTSATPVAFEVVVDGDGDGVTAADISSGADPVVMPADRLDVHFPRVRFGIVGPVPAIDDTGMLGDGDDPVRFGANDQLSLAPSGTASGGTAYLVSRGGVQLAVRISGVTGRARVLRYERGAGVWRPL